MNNPFFDPNNFSSEDFSENQTDETPSPQTTKTLQKLFAILISIGLVIGIVTSVVIVKLMNKYGLTEKTNQLEQIQPKNDN
jgi:hypothetical protein